MLERLPKTPEGLSRPYRIGQKVYIDLAQIYSVEYRAEGATINFKNGNCTVTAGKEYFRFLREVGLSWRTPV